MKNPELTLPFSKLRNALSALDVALATPPLENDLHIDAVIHRFEFVFELFWKLLKGILKSQGVDAEFPKGVLQQAYMGHLIDQESVWLDMLKSRNLTSHTYNLKIAKEIYDEVKHYAPLLRRTFEKLSESFGSTSKEV